MSDVRWEPVEDGYEHRTERQAVRVYGEQLQNVRLDPEGPGYDVWTNITLPPDLRLCRAVPVTPAPGDVFVGQPIDAVPVQMRVQDVGIGRPIAVDLDIETDVTWSQEPPTWGDWWCWHRSEEVRRAKVRQADIAGFWKVIFDDGDFALMNKNKNWLGYWWMRYTVPQPPEVGP